MDPEKVAQFVELTGATTQKAQSYLKVSDNNLEAALTLFFDTGGVDIEADIPTSNPSPPVRQAGTGSQPIDVDDDDLAEAMRASGAAAGGSNTYEDDEAMARRLQEEFYGSGGGSSSMGGDEVRAPMARTRETLVGPDIDDGYGYAPRIPRQTRAGIFSQRTTVWDEGPPESLSPEERQRRLAAATAGASEKSSHARRLAELFRPPVEIITNLSFEDARDEARDGEKWILVNIQDDAVFQSQVLNRDIWRDKDVQQCIREHFLFLQMNRAGRDGRDYIRLYMPDVNAGLGNDLFPHIAIIDPRTGEQVKVWKEMPQNPLEFVHTVYEFLERYSLHEDAKNPVQRTAKPKPVNVDAMTEDEMLQLAMQQSLDASTPLTPRAQDPDELTREPDFMDVEEEAPQSKGKEVANSPFQRIASDRHHQEPHPGPDSTRIQFKMHDGSRVVRRFLLKDPVERLFEYVKADLLPEKGASADTEFDLVSMGKKLIDVLVQTVEEAGLKMGTVMVETIED